MYWMLALGSSFNIHKLHIIVLCFMMTKGLLIHVYIITY